MLLMKSKKVSEADRNKEETGQRRLINKCEGRMEIGTEWIRRKRTNKKEAEGRKEMCRG